MLRHLLALSILRSEANPDGGGGGGAPAPAPGAPLAGGQPAPAPEPTLALTQAQLDQIVQRAIAKEKRGTSRTVAEITQAKAQLEAELAEARAAAEGAGDPSKNPEIAKAQREAAAAKAQLEALAKEKAEALAKLEGMTKAQRDRAVSDTLRAELTRAGAHAPGLEQAARLLAMEGAAEVDEDDGSITLTISGIPYRGATLAKAVAVWLAANPHFAKSPAGGSGANRPNGNGRMPADFSTASPVDLISAGLSRPPGS